MVKRTINAKGRDIELDIVSPSENFRGRTYGEWLGESWKKLLSTNPDSPNDSMFFIRTSPNVNQAPLTMKVTISANQSIFVPTITAECDKNDPPGSKTAEEWRAAANNDIDQSDPPSNVVATIDGQPIVEDLGEFRVESPMFSLHVTNGSRLRDHLEVPMPTGDWQAVAAGYCIIIKSLRPRDEPYIIEIKAKGCRNYKTEAIYELTVK